MKMVHCDLMAIHILPHVALEGKYATAKCQVRKRNRHFTA
jgi:hypothetical protein